MIALLGRRDSPADALEDYCRWLSLALERRGRRLQSVRVPWEEAGPIRALRELWRESREWKGQWALVQYTALSWSRSGFPLFFLATLGILKMRRTRLAVVFHDATAYSGSRAIDFARAACQRFVMSVSYRWADRGVLTVPLESVAWLPPAPTKAVFIPVGSNVPPLVPASGNGARPRNGLKTVAVFSMTDRNAPEVDDIAFAAKAAAQQLPRRLRLVTLGRGSKAAETRLREELNGAPIEFVSLGMLPPEEVSRTLAASDVLLCARGPLSTQRGSAIAGIACGLPLVAYAKPRTGPPLTEAGVLLVPERDRRALSAALIRVLTDAELWQELHLRSIRAQQEHFSWDAIAERYLTVLATDERKYRVLLVGSHPVQYAAPVLRKMAQQPELEIKVVYCSLQGAEPGVDPEFGVKLQWDVPLLEGYPWVHVPNRSPRPGLGRFLGLFNPGLWKLVRQGGYDAVVIYTGYRCASFWIATAAAKLSGVPLLFGTDATNLGSPNGGGWKGRLKPLYLPLIFRLADVCISPSEATSRFIWSLGVPKERVVLTPFVVDNELWNRSADRVDRRAVRSRWGVPENEPEKEIVILFCAKLQPWKRPQDLLRAFAKLKSPECYLVFAGDGPLRGKLEAEAKTLGVSARVRFLGFVNQTGLPELYRAADLLVLPSDYDACPVVVCEAMLCGCPVVLSDQIRGRFDLVHHGVTGFIYPCGDVDALRSVLRQALSDPEQLGRVSAAARKRMEAWSPRENIEGHVQAVKRACALKRGLAA
jgi:glycosyltransferase involved in cell wall biosynthesis